MNRIAALAPPLLAACLLMAATAGAAPAPPSALPQALQQSIERTLATSPDLPSISLTVHAPLHRLAWTGVAGRIRFDGAPATVPLSFRIASVTKVFVATATLRLVEQRRLALTAPIAGLVSDATAASLRAGGYDPQAISLRHLLEHTSGLRDHATTDAYQARVVAEPRHRWTRAEQIAIAMADGAPLAPPGEAYSYSDTGYVILGEIVERATGEPLPRAVRELDRFAKLGLRATWFETLEPVPRGAPARFHQYWQRIDTTDFDPSFDLYGGGGLVSTTSDLATFLRALLTGQVFERPGTLAVALATPDVRHAEGRTPHAPLLPVVRVGAHQCWGHGGFFGALALYCPDVDVAIAISVNANPGRPDGTLRRVAEDAIAILDAAAAR